MGRERLPFDPIDQAARQWEGHGLDQVARMRAVASLMRAHQLVISELDEVLRPLGLTFARYEVLVLLSFSKRGAVALGKIGERLQVHATSVTSLARRLSAAGLIRRDADPDDGRAVLASLTPKGRELLERATEAVTAAEFAMGSMSEPEAEQLFGLLRGLRTAAGDF